MALAENWLVGTVVIYYMFCAVFHTVYVKIVYISYTSRYNYFYYTRTWIWTAVTCTIMFYKTNKLKDEIYILLIINMQVLKIEIKTLH